jgi:Carboxypeptidase regulatory-like domain
MKRLIVPLVTLLFISAFAQETRPKRESLISGRVVADDGQPMAGAQVMAFGVGKSIFTNALQRTNCDADGNFKVTGLSNGVYSIVAWAPGYVSVQDQSRKYRTGESVHRPCDRRVRRADSRRPGLGRSCARFRRQARY